MADSNVVEKKRIIGRVLNNLFGKKKGEIIESSNPFPIMRMTKEALENRATIQCKCGHVHFRHGGYVKKVTPFVETKPNGNEAHVVKSSTEIWFCIKCKTPYSWEDDALWDWSDWIDFKDWEAFEKEAHEATGPGGQC
ncbi:MAG: hypothetical protein H8D97_01470 [Proteobacteria bacterium]|nr:hypothetical protein [Pseudomonadota bacterium]